MSKYVKTKEPPCTERYARWCERSGILLKIPSYSILSVALGWHDIQAAEKEIYMRTFFLMIASQTYSKI